MMDLLGMSLRNLCLLLCVEALFQVSFRVNIRVSADSWFSKVGESTTEIIALET